MDSNETDLEFKAFNGLCSGHAIGISNNKGKYYVIAFLTKPHVTFL